MFVTVKDRDHTMTCGWRHREKVELWLLCTHKLVLKGGGWLETRSDRFTTGKNTIPIVREGGRASELVWTGAENLACNAIQSPDSPATSQSLHCLHIT